MDEPGQTKRVLMLLLTGAFAVGGRLWSQCQPSPQDLAVKKAEEARRLNEYYGQERTVTPQTKPPSSQPNWRKPTP